VWEIGNNQWVQVKSAWERRGGGVNCQHYIDQKESSNRPEGNNVRLLGTGRRKQWFSDVELLSMKETMLV